MVTNYLDARGVRIRGRSWYGLLGTLGRYSWCTIAVCMYRPRPDDEPANPELPLVLSCVNKTSCTDVRFHRRDSADQRIDLVDEIGSLFYVLKTKSLLNRTSSLYCKLKKKNTHTRGINTFAITETKL